MENTMGMRIKQLRLQAHMTQEELGKVIGVNKAAIQKYESGQTMNMKRNKIAALSKFFKVSPTWLMGFDEEQDSQPETKQENHEIDCDLIDACFGKDAYKLVQTFLKLNDVGQAKAIEYPPYELDEYGLKKFKWDKAALNCAAFQGVSV